MKHNNLYNFSQNSAETGDFGDGLGNESLSDNEDT